MTKRKLTIAGIVAAVVLVAVPFVYAQQRHFHGEADGFGPLGHLARIQKQLDLSDQQVDQIKAIFADLHQQNAQYRQQVHGGLKDVLDTLIKDPNNTAAAQAILDQQSQAEHAMRANMLAAVSKALNVLTPDQRTKLGDLVAQRAARFENKF